jgi:hypothetical protein
MKLLEIELYDLYKSCPQCNCPMIWQYIKLPIYIGINIVNGLLCQSANKGWYCSQCKKYFKEEEES